MAKNKIYILLLILVGLITSCSQNEEKSTRGVFNLSCSQPVDARLDGYWEFYWDKIYTPEDFKTKSITEKPVYIKVPSSWTTLINKDSSKVKRFGKATYRARIILPKHDTTYALKINIINSAYRLYIDDTLFYSAPPADKKHKNEICKSELHAQTYYFVAHRDTVDIILNVCNYSHRKAGITQKITIGNAQIIAGKELLYDALTMFIFGGLLIIGIYHLWLFNYRRRYWEALFFALATISAAVYSIFSGNFLIYKLIPISWEWSYKINYLANIGRTIFFILFLNEAFKGAIGKRIMKFYTVSYSIEALIVLLTPAKIYSFTLGFIVLTGLAFFLYMSYFLLEQIKKKNQVAVVSSIGFGFLFAAIINDILNQFNIVNTIETTNLGLFLFVAVQSIILSEKYIKNYIIAEQLSQFLKKLDKIKKDLLEIQYKDVKNIFGVIKKHFAPQSISLIVKEDDTYLLYAQEIGNQTKLFKNQLITLGEIYKDKALYRIIPELVEFTIEKNEMIRINYNSNIYKLLNIDKHVGSKSIIVLPLLSNEKLLGFLYLEKTDQIFTREQQETLKLLAIQISAIINNVLTFGKLEELNQNLQKIVKKRTAEIEKQKSEVEEKTLELDEKIEELSITTLVINSINEELQEQKEILEEKNTLLSTQNKELNEQKNLLSELNKQLTDSINYAQRIQLTLLTSPSNKPDCQHFIFYSPKEIVSGDFWWIRRINDCRIMIIGDTNKHGVTGAFKSLYIITRLNLMFASAGIKNLDKATEFIEQFYKAILSSDMELKDTKLTIAIFKDHKIIFNKGENYIYLSRGGRLKELSEPEVQRSFTLGEEQLQENDMLYFATDGLFKELSKKYRYKKVEQKAFISKLAAAPIEQQKNLIINNLHTYNITHVDDILVIGIKI